MHIETSAGGPSHGGGGAIIIHCSRPVQCAALACVDLYSAANGDKLVDHQHRQAERVVVLQLELGLYTRTNVWCACATAAVMRCGCKLA